jgi:hypothetical protein
LAVSVAYRLIEPGSEWRCHRLWYERSAMGDLLGEGYIWGGKDQLYGVLDRLLEHRWRSAKLTHLCSAKLTQRFKAGGGAFSFQVVEGVGVEKP